MAETIQTNGLWHVTLVERDLVDQAGLDSKDFEQDFGFFKYKGRRVIVSHTYDEHLVVSMDGQGDDDLKQLVDAFSKIVGYQPFCKYALEPQKGLPDPVLATYEWDKIDPNSRYQELSQRLTKDKEAPSQRNLTDLVRL